MLHKAAVMNARRRGISLNEFVKKAIEDECALTGR
ncbi:MAG: toxin-antitoxin system HicB family antitoxin [Lachnospiraceae bacterium]|nr:toxin-antitoxin system HicB family antitoxin [Lachnospiraceae bacterium]